MIEHSRRFPAKNIDEAKGIFRIPGDFHPEEDELNETFETQKTGLLIETTKVTYSVIFNQGDKKYLIPSGTIIGQMHFLPKNENLTDIIMDGVDGLSQYFKSVDQLRAAGNKSSVPEFLTGMTNKRMASFAKRLGFSMVHFEDSAEDTYGILGETKYIEANFKKLIKNSRIKQNLESRINSHEKSELKKIENKLRKIVRDPLLPLVISIPIVLSSFPIDRAIYSDAKVSAEVLKVSPEYNYQKYIDANDLKEKYADNITDPQVPEDVLEASRYLQQNRAGYDLETQRKMSRDMNAVLVDLGVFIAVIVQLGIRMKMSRKKDHRRY